MKTLHPLTWWIWTFSLVIALARANSSILAIVLLAIVSFVVWQKADATPWGRSFHWALRMGLLVFLIRLFTGVLISVGAPGKVLFTLPKMPLPNFMVGIRIGGEVTLERISATAHQGLILGVIIALLGAASSLTSPHRILRLIPIMVYEFGIIVVIATTVLPQLVAGIARVRQARLLRGHNVKGLSQWPAMVIPVLEDSLSRSLDLAAAMDSRGYGISRKRSRYRPEKWGAVDALMSLAALICIFIPNPLVIATALLPLALSPNPIEVRN
ncbi:MAG: hypothetical protein F2704_02315 [Actinobacteria bacterium]|uniref:Unannotated protein n=1 Tax=freshwater metagenome TaxID=449393 RepID=A0A6J7CKU7_9ZZZZ|nr:energy-coupling factor transporter transmembrane component T [Actinomycetota bacterium]MSW46868.1 hypothetical protein [Actinomycetota bacterium]MSX24450.1 hypothetical protein [Actinomycetota bacterium]MSY45995.1 hypothetical protein [Actinomycetota bacterium]MSY57088.1 hypothetical protein [Actinomycetota bacterium]